MMPDGRKVHVKISGPEEGTTLVLTHGWGLTSREWYYLQRDLSKRYRIVSWDLPGLGQSQSPADSDWSLEKLAKSLDLVIEKAGPRPVVLVGHSIGVMITLTYCRLFLDVLDQRFADWSWLRARTRILLRPPRWHRFTVHFRSPFWNHFAI